MEVMMRQGELWFDIKNLSASERRQLLQSDEEKVFDPDDKITYVRASYYAKIWPEFQVIGNDMARKLKVKLPWPEN
jgi:hypothetical protein